MKKKIIICAFSALILITAIYFITGAIDSYNYDIEKGVDILVGFGAALIITFGGFVVLYELDLFYTTYYFFIKPKTKTKTILNIFSNLSLLLYLVYICLSSIFMKIRVFENAALVLLFIYVILRTAYLIVSTVSSNQEE